MNMNLVKMFAEGTLTTLELTFISIGISTILGLFVALARISKNKILKSLSWTYVWIFRGTPLLLQIAVFFVTIPTIIKSITGTPVIISAFMSGCLALTFNSAAYLSEIYRAAINSIDKGQMEAAKALGMNYRQAMFKVIVPQTYRRIIPPYSNEFTMILKDSSLVSSIGLAELFRASERLSSSTGNYRYLFIAAAIYLFLTTISTFVFSRLEKKFSIHL